jgi:hypothetical protein
VIDVGWWYQLALPELPSGKLKTTQFGLKKIVGEGNIPIAFADAREIGKFVVRIISDQRTLNKMVFCYNEILTTNQIWDMLEKLSGETVPRVYVSVVI